MLNSATLRLHDDGLMPNNDRLPLLLYRAGLGTGLAAAAVIRRFAANGWTDAWINGIYPFQHYHATAHEVLGIAGGQARVQLGGESGPVVTVGPGDVLVIPAGVGHCRLEQIGELVVIGAYPAGQVPDLRRATAGDRAEALALIAAVPLPATDPLHGRRGPLTRHWR